MTLRGGARQFDENGVCNPQKLVTSADRTRLLANFDRLFPGATIEVMPLVGAVGGSGAITANGRSTARGRPYAAELIDIFGRPGLPNVISTSWISEENGQAVARRWPAHNGDG
jgi:hypothetical protein